MDDSYYGTGKPSGGRHKRPSDSNVDDAQTPENPPVADEAPASEEAAASSVAEAAEAADVADAAEAAEVDGAADAAEAAEAAGAADAAEAADAAGAAEAADASPAAATGKKKRGPWGIVFIVALIVFICSMVALALIAFSYCQGQQKYESVAREAGLEVIPEDPETLEIDWDALREANPDVVGWIYVPNTPINYPVVQGPDNDKYLTVDFDGDAGWLANYGAIFLDYRNNPNFSDKANFIYGHHMNDGSMFADLANFTDQARFDECRTVYLLTPDANYRLRSFALLHIDETDPLVQNEFADDEEYQKYVQDKIDRSVVNAGEIPAAKDMDRVFALATCDDSGAGRFVLYSYIDDKKATGLTGTVGIAQEDGAAVGFDDGLAAEEEQAEGEGQEFE